MGKSKRSLSPAAPSNRKGQVAAPEPPAGGDMPPGAKPTWGMSHLDLDHEGSWSWLTASTKDLRELTTFLASIEKQTWAEISRATYSGGMSGTHRCHKLVPTDQLCPEAQRRLTGLRLDHVEDLFEFRVNSTFRLWGLVRHGVFFPLWRDPDHKVYPVSRR